MIRMNAIPSLTLLAFLVILLDGCLVVNDPYTAIAPGYWRASLQLDPKYRIDNPEGRPIPEAVDVQFEEVTAGELPFVFEVIYENEQDFYIDIINGEERLRVDDIKIGRDQRISKDTILINFPVFDSYIRATCEANVIEGEWVVNYKENYRIPFVAHQGQNYRFTTLRKTPVMDVSGRWEVLFEVDTDKPFPAIGEFQQDGNYLTGTFLTETGDYRFLEGTIQENKLYLSCFDGSHAFLFEAKIQEDSTLIGSFRSGSHYKALWEGRRNSEFTLSDPDSLTFLKKGYDRLDFSFQNTQRKTISLSDSAFQSKVCLIQIMGTWCPNCRDETLFLKDYLANHPGKDIAVIALAFERYQDQEKALKVLRTYKERMDIPYEVLYAGSYKKEEAAQSLPMLNQILSYPTLIFIDKKGQVRKIHTGFSGPATSEYEAFKTEFDTFINQLLAESIK
ncbi:MAG TPA: TlpA disulfide reductase family protein [Saprospiraceae bacterium]|nr:TlpA disulfide reductase family protein [Saprospiraceae bacterium]HMQ84533.1 TlpA disulfide reductase family protein [Saprospiraceae bacterium]